MPDGKAKRRGPGSTERRRAGGRRRPPPDGTLRSLAAQADAILESAPLGVVMVDPEGHIVWVNARLEEMFGYSPGELAGLSLETLVPERLRGVHAEHRTGFVADPRMRPMGLGLDLMARRKDGHEFPVEVSLSFIQPNGSLVALGFVIDISLRRAAERRLQAQFAVTRTLAEAPVIEHLGQGVVQAISETLGWSVGELWRVDGGELRWDGSWHEAGLDATEYEAASRDLRLRPGVGLAGRVWAAGRALWVADVQRETWFSRRPAAATLGLRTACAFPIGDPQAPNGVVVLFGRELQRRDEALLTMLTDVGRRIGQHLELRRAEQELARQRDMLYQSEKLAAVGRLVAGVAHEMNNPLGIISSRIELMLTEAAGQSFPLQHLEDLKVIHRNVLRVAGVAQALRSFARQSPGERRPVDLNTVVGETLLLAGKTMSTDNVRIVTALDGTLPPLLGNANALQQVLLNLVTNAREAMTAGGEIHIETGLDPRRPGRVRLVVADTGPGIRASDLPHLFEPFYTTKPAGTGLGLAVSYGIVQDHAGTIEVKSSPGQGARFTLSFPILDRSPGPA